MIASERALPGDVSAEPPQKIMLQIHFGSHNQPLKPLLRHDVCAGSYEERKKSQPVASRREVRASLSQFTLLLALSTSAPAEEKSLPLQGDSSEQQKPEEDRPNAEAPVGTREPPNDDGQSAAPVSQGGAGLVPLEELQEQRYRGLWWADFRFHSAEFTLHLITMDVSGSLIWPTGSDQQSGTAELQGQFALGGVAAAYYVPLVGMGLDASVGLLPILQGSFGASGDPNDAPDRYTGEAIYAAYGLPTFLVFRYGRHASRGSDRKLSVGAGIGFSYLRFDTGYPVIRKGSHFAPALRLALGWRGVRLAYRLDFAGGRQTFAVGDAEAQLRFSSHTLSFGGTLQPSSK